MGPVTHVLQDVLAYCGYSNKLLPTGWVKKKRIVSQFRWPEVPNRGVSRVMLRLQALGEDPSWLLPPYGGPTVPWLVHITPVSPSVFTQPLSLCPCPFLSLVRIFSLDVGPNLTRCDLISILA